MAGKSFYWLAATVLAVAALVLVVVNGFLVLGNEQSQADHTPAEKVALLKRKAPDRFSKLVLEGASRALGDIKNPLRPTGQKPAS